MHDLELGHFARHGPQQPVAPGRRLVEYPGRHQRLEGERGVAEPVER